MLKSPSLYKNEKFLYTYDFTAGWDEVRLERIGSPKDKKIYPICISDSGASPDEECGGPIRFSKLKDYWLIKADEIFIEFLTVLVDDKNFDKMISEVFDMYELREASWGLVEDSGIRLSDISNFSSSTIFPFIEWSLDCLTK